MYQVYLQSEPDYSGRVTVPVLWDKRTGAAVSNESSEIIRMFNSAVDAAWSNKNETEARLRASCFFTSGTTGEPKGCVCTVGNLFAYIRVF